MSSRRRITAALVTLLVLVAVAWLVQQATSDEPSPFGGASLMSRVTTSLMS